MLPPHRPRGPKPRPRLWSASASGWSRKRNPLRYINVWLLPKCTLHHYPSKLQEKPTPAANQKAAKKAVTSAAKQAKRIKKLLAKKKAWVVLSFSLDIAMHTNPTCLPTRRRRRARARAAAAAASPTMLKATRCDPKRWHLLRYSQCVVAVVSCRLSRAFNL